MRKLIPLFIVFLLLTSCSPTTEQLQPSPEVSSTIASSPTVIPPLSSQTATHVPPSTVTPIPQAFQEPARYGPELDQFPSDVNPLTGLSVPISQDLLSSAVLVSISNSPVTAKPQAGLSFASSVNEFFLGYGTTRYLAVFYGEHARRISDYGGDCLSEPMAILPQRWVGGKAWLDENQNGIFEDWELGVPGICIDLRNLETGAVIARTGTTSNGTYYFDITNQPPSFEGRLSVELPEKLSVTKPNIGFEDQDSDVDPTTLSVSLPHELASAQHLDIGLFPTVELPLTYLPNDIAPDRTYVGPIRSGRLSYNDFDDLFPTGCLVFASAGADILPQLDPCELIFGEEKADNPNTSLLDIEHLREISVRNNNPMIPINYSGNLFDSIPPADGSPATIINQYFHQFSQARWVYDPQSESYLRYTDDLDGSGIFHPDVDRLTNRQLMFENVIYLFADYEIYRHNQYDISLCCGLEGWATLFRDGKMYRIRWSTNNREWEKTTGIVRPIKFIGADKLPFPLKPGHSWVSLYTTSSAITETQPGVWQALFSMPNDLVPEE